MPRRLYLPHSKMSDQVSSGSRVIERVWFDGPQSYETVIADMRRKAEQVARQESNEAIWFLEHDHVVTTGSDRANTYSGPLKLHCSDRGGGHTYHGPGQQIVYPILRLARFGSVTQYVDWLEDRVIAALAMCGISSMRSEIGRGVWVNHAGQMRKIASIGIRVSRCVTSHGVAINVNPNMEHFKSIEPCGFSGATMICASELGVDIASPLKLALDRSFAIQTQLCS